MRFRGTKARPEGTRHNLSVARDLSPMFDIIIIFLLLAILASLVLRRVLGGRTGHQRPPAPDPVGGSESLQGPCAPAASAAGSTNL